MSSVINGFQKPLELKENITAVQVEAFKITTTKLPERCTNPLRSEASCRVNYKTDQISLSFESFIDQWVLQKLVIDYNGSIVKTFSCDIQSTKDLFETIEVQFEISAMNISFFDASLKKFTFELSFEMGSESFKAKYQMELPVIKEHTFWQMDSKLLDFYHPSLLISDFFSVDLIVPEDCADTKLIALGSLFAEYRKIKVLRNRFESHGYCKMFAMMLSIEDLTVRKALDDLSMTDKTVNSTRHPFHFEVHFDAGKKLSEKLEFNHLVLTPMSDYQPGRQLSSMDEDGSRIFNRIIKIDGNRVVFQKPKRFSISTTTPYHVQLVENRIPTRLAFATLKRVTDLDLESFFISFDETKLKSPLPKQERLFKIRSINPLIGRNQSQMSAVTQIVSRSSFPAPYVVFGPPGTGKTSTLVEAIAQIIKIKPSAKILVTANSNTACDEVGERLLKYIPRYLLYRLYSPSFDISFSNRYKRIHPLMKPISNMKNDRNAFPSYEEFYSYSVVISTLVNSGRLMTAGIKSNHFDYIFIDECASTIEPLSIIPVVMLGASEGRINAQIVLAGDHKQLQGLVHSYFNEKHGYGISLMERVMALDNYKYPYDVRFVTQLTDNFRSHPAILKFSNYRFYNSVLQAKQKKEIAEFAINWERLPNKNFPLIFHSIMRSSELDGTSLYNTEEIHIVTTYVNRLLKDGINGQNVQASDIGIICPYGAQRKRLEQELKFVADLEVGTVDSFQGREKLIIILSTVRSQTPTVGFLKNEKRLNVALTRAKALLIVIGNGETLQKNKLWYKFLNYCFQNGAMVGEKFMLRYRKEGTGTSGFKKPHPMFHVPKVPLEIQTPNSDGELEDEYDPCSSDDDSGSDVSWTHEDHRMKARTAKLGKWQVDDFAEDFESADEGNEGTDEVNASSNEANDSSDEVGQSCYEDYVSQADLSDNELVESSIQAPLMTGEGSQPDPNNNIEAIDKIIEAIRSFHIQ